MFSDSVFEEILCGIFRVDVVPDVVLGDVLVNVVVVFPPSEVSKEKGVVELMLRWIDVGLGRGAEEVLDGSGVSG